MAETESVYGLIVYGFAMFALFASMGVLIYGGLKASNSKSKLKHS